MEKILKLPSSRTLTLVDDRKIGVTFTEEALVAISNLKTRKILIVFLRKEKAKEQELLSKIVATNDIVIQNWKVKFEGNELSLVRKEKTTLQIGNEYRVSKKTRTRVERIEQIEDTIKRAMMEPLLAVISPVLNGNKYHPVLKPGLIGNIGLESKYR